jgi:DNA-binding NtrC family response regulator
MSQAQSRPIALVVETDHDQRALVSVLLEETELHVIECDSAEAALAVMDATGDRVSMVFTDVGLAGPMDGVELARNLEAQSPEMPVIVTSPQNDRVRGLPDNVIYLAQPWRPLDVLIVAERARLAA